MGRAPAFRIVRWELKVLYIVVAWIVAYAFTDLLRALGTPAVALEVVNTLVNLAAFAFAVRIFRGQDEPIDPPRAWWRMTAWPTLSRRLGILFAVFAASGLIFIVLEVAGVDVGTAAVPYGVTGSITMTLQFALLAFLYLNSAVRMARLGIAKPQHLHPTIRLT
ncbi:hypothetical protein [Agromyces cerinus]|uniref:Uncharacterized protein n=1 Tax=Agromyces cerinus subsp. cerinus TaxID=232089 RepID=A0A1N6DDI6_9MICO|nr:hypothetical protein [Agromyces cerinus]SIN68796.1 hypothetical protein SAMN05443544_0055 [Agromyces cerinus subsp. cerinus]